MKMKNYYNRIEDLDKELELLEQEEKRIKIKIKIRRIKITELYKKIITKHENYEINEN
jgi:hypothetical protein